MLGAFRAFVGKTSLANRFVRGNFSEYHFATVGGTLRLRRATRAHSYPEALHLEKIVELDKTRVKVEIWDTGPAGGSLELLTLL